MACPTFEALVDVVDDRLSPADRQAIEAHLAAGCPECAETIAWLQQVLPRLPAAAPFGPLPSVLDRARHILTGQLCLSSQPEPDA